MQKQPDDFDKCPQSFGEMPKEVKEEKKAVVYDMYKVLESITAKKLETLQYPIYVILQDKTIYLIEKKPKKKEDEEMEMSMDMEMPKGKKQSKPIMLLEITPLYVGEFKSMGVLKKTEIFDDMLTKFCGALAWLTSKGFCLGDIVFADAK